MDSCGSSDQIFGGFVSIFMFNNFDLVVDKKDNGDSVGHVVCGGVVLAILYIYVSVQINFCDSPVSMINDC